MHTVASRILDALQSLGIDRLYCLPGTQNNDFFDALYDRQHEIRPVVTRHEQGAAYMALGAAMATGRPQACCVVPGPGLLNAAAAMATAWAVNAPLLMIVGQTAAQTYGQQLGELHEIPDQLSILKQLSKHADRIVSGADAMAQITRAVSMLTTGRPRPVALEVPLDVWKARAPALLQEIVVSPISRSESGYIARAAEMIGAAKRPLIVVGSGARAGRADVLALAEAISAPVMSNRAGRGVVSAHHPKSVVENAARAVWARADLVVGLGTRLGSRLAIWGRDESLRSVHIDIDPAELRRGDPADLGIAADLADALPALMAALPTQPTRTDWEAEAAMLKREEEALAKEALAPLWSWLQVIRAALPEDGIYVNDLTQVGYAADAMYPVLSPRTFLSSGFQGTLGWGFAAGLGAALTVSAPVIAVTGDGGVMFTIQELATAKRYRIPLTTIVFTDNAFGNVKRSQIQLFNGRLVAWDLVNPDFVALARSFDVHSGRAQTPEALSGLLAEAITSREPWLIEVPVGELPSPWPFMWPRRLRGGR